MIKIEIKNLVSRLLLLDVAFEYVSGVRVVVINHCIMIVVSNQTASVNHACVLAATVLGLQLRLLGKSVPERLRYFVHLGSLIRLVLGLIK